MRSNGWIAALLLAASILATVGPAAATSPAQASIIGVDMEPLNDSAEWGTATLTQVENGVEVVIAINAPCGTQPVEILLGRCSKISAASKYALKNTIDGNSSTVVEGITLGDLTARKYAILVHRSATDLSTYVSCGDIL